jgi:hypothetical protein
MINVWDDWARRWLQVARRRFFKTVELPMDIDSSSTFLPTQQRRQMYRPYQAGRRSVLSRLPAVGGRLHLPMYQVSLRQ